MGEMEKNKNKFCLKNRKKFINHPPETIQGTYIVNIVKFKIIIIIIHTEICYFSDVLRKKVSIFVCLRFFMRAAERKLSILLT